MGKHDDALILWFDDIGIEDVPLVGGKNASLGEMYQYLTSKGVAVPHGRTDAVDRLVCAIGVSPDGVDFGAADGEPTRIVVLVLTPRDGADPYLQFVASVMGALDEEGRRLCLSAQTGQELWLALTQPR